MPIERRFASFFISTLIACCSAGSVPAAITATGDVSPSPPVFGDSIQIGYSSIGTLLIDGGSTFESSEVMIGPNPQGAGKAIVMGNGSYWKINYGSVGSSGLGRLEIRNGGIVEVTGGGQLRVGENTNGNGTVLVENAGSLLHIASQLMIGGFSSGSGVLQVGAGAIVNVPTNSTTVRPGGRIELQGGYLRTSGIENQGLISGTGEINVHSFGFVENSGRIEVGPGDRLVVATPSGPEFNNRGELAVRGGELEFSSRVENTPQGDWPATITLQDGVLRAGLIGVNQGQPQLTNRGLIAAIDGESHVHGKVLNDFNGRITVANDSLLMFHNRVESQSNSTISVFPGSTAIFLDDLVMNGGTLLADLAGIDGFGHVEVVGDLFLDGMLQVNLGADYTPQAGDMFPLMSVAGNVAGDLNVSSTSDLPEGLAWKLLIGAHSVALSVVAPLAGDYNGDGSVDAADYSLWRDTLGSDSELAADGNGNNIIDEDDYNVWKENFGATSGGGTASLAVPEPVSFIMMALGMSFLLTPSRRLGRT